MVLGSGFLIVLTVIVVFFSKNLAAMFLMIFYYIIVRMPLAKLLSTTQLELNGIWSAVLISHIAAAIAGCLGIFK